MKHLLLLFVLSFNASLVAAPLRALIMETEPWGFHDETTGQAMGIWLEIAALIEAESGLQQQKRLVPYARVLESLHYGDADLSYLIRAPARDGEVQHAGYLFSFGSVVLAREGIKLERYEDLAGLRIGVLRGIRLSPRFDADTSLNKVYLRNYETLIGMLAAGRLDAISGNSLSLMYLSEQLQVSELLGDRLVLQATPVTVQFSLHYEDTQRMERIQQAVERLQQSGAIEQVLDRWAGPDWRVTRESES
ncbi:substrate-binding periplasmic protein [Marinospirillum alkaliphilum]|uniref:Polar amino acid transport system substrate-binding protein n=1 Tax=Marinospirillum alkaliphilum DSM 21637 TaxID=1122209 RepID=A0A1K1X4E9_9GAMM|nr:ABC transporter substrate-binding protein [Marinospirillum alkaliphilum]SFX43941.1 polar amino acid transport system substrate-binding protein [Marinospirillum alkaliphilum DSM 21637]